MLDVHEIVENAKNIFAENKTKTIVISLVLIFMTFCAVIMLAVQDSKSKEKKTPQAPQKTLVIDQNLFAPEGPVVPNEYTTSKKAGEKWTPEQIDEWFTYPDGKELENLNKVNSKIVNDILEAAP